MTVRILHIVTYMGRGGLETMIMNYYRQIDRSKIQFDFLVHREFEADYDEEIKKMGGKIYRLPRLNPFSKEYTSQLNNFFDNHKEYNIVHSHIDCMSGIPLKVAKSKGIKVRIAHAHSSNQTKDWKYLLKIGFKKNITKYANELFACGDVAGNWMFGKKSFYILNNAINAESYIYNENEKIKMRSLLNIPEDAMVVGHIGRFSHPKNHKFIIDIFDEIIKAKPNSYLLLVGDGELKSKIEEKAKLLGISNQIIFTGIRKDIKNILQAMDVFLFPSIYEGLPVALVEAQASGLPCFISDKVPIECKKTESVYQISLNSTSKEWANIVIDLAQAHKRINTYKDIRKHKFDIVENTRWLEEFYIKSLQK